MADKEVYVTGDRGNGTLGVVIGFLIVALIAIGLLFFTGILRPNGGSGVNVQVETPKVAVPGEGR
jgi:hypothetical protein